MLHLLSGLNVILEVTTGVLPCLQALVEELGYLAGILIRDGIVVGHVGGRSGRQGAFCGSHVCGSVWYRSLILKDRRISWMSKGEILSAAEKVAGHCHPRSTMGRGVTK